MALTVVVLLVIAHTALSYIDVKYTQPKRFISPIEQHAHALLDVLPFVAVAVLAVLDLRAASSHWRQPALTSTQLILLMGSFLALGGAPILEEMLRTRRAARHAGLATMR